MTEKKARSMFIPLLLVWVLSIGLCLLVTLVPLAECLKCSGDGYQSEDLSMAGFVRTGDVNNPLRSREALQYLLDTPPRCERCEGNGKVPLLNIWRREAEEGRILS